jgi:hypothetical protein
MSVTGTTRHISMPKLESYLPRLRDAAKAIASDAADWRFPDTPSPARGAARAASH